MKKLVLLFTAIILTGTMSYATVDSRHMTTETFLMNSGYSRDMAKLIDISNHDVYAPTDDRFGEHGGKRFWKNVWKKIDATSFPDENFLWHDIKFNNSIYDL